MGSVRGNETNLSLRKKERCSRDLSTRHIMNNRDVIYLLSNIRNNVKLANRLVTLEVIRKRLTK